MAAPESFEIKKKIRDIFNQNNQSMNNLYL